MYYYYVLAAFIIALDQFTKWLVVQNMDLYEQIPIIDNFFSITSHRNSGAAWGILQNQMVFFYIITVIVIVGVLYFMHKFAKQSKLLTIGLSLVLGGAIGNFIDRLLHQEVVDFLDFKIINYNFPIFNVADSSLVIGVGLLIVMTFIEDRKERKTMNE
ncbi:signal peptidase II [Virgibacillus soli]|uniref:signal peptidase II n=1 Tax=Paracerasibacillus soli TaxID=480284 RepID=UPI0035ED6C39